MGLWNRATAAAVKALTLGAVDLDKIKAANRLRAGVLPIGINTQALGIKTFEDIAADPRRLYAKMQSSFPVYHAVDTHGTSIGALDIRIIGYTADGPEGNPENKPELMSETAQALQKCFTHSMHIHEMLRMSSWAYPEGVLFWQKRWAFVENVGMVLDCRGGERHKALAGGRLWLGDDFESVYTEENYNQYVDAEERKARRESIADWFVFMPFCGSNPNGTNALARLMLRSAGMYEDVEYSEAIYCRQYALPHPVLKYIMDGMAPGADSSRMQDDADDFGAAAPGSIFAIGDKNILDYLEPKGTGIAFLPERETREESKCLRLMNGTALLSDTRATGPSGSSKEARTTSNVFTACGARTAGEWLSIQAIPDMIRQNEIWCPGRIPKYKPGEMPCYAELTLPGQWAGDTPKTQGPAADAKPQDKRPAPEGRTQVKDNSVPPVK